MAIADIERLHQRVGVKLASQPSVFSAPTPLLEYFIGVLAGNPPPVPNAPTGDWWQLINLTYPHKLIPLFYFETEKLPETQRPPELVRRQLKRLYVESRLRGLMMAAQLKDTVAAFQAGGVDVLVLKGLAVAHAYYPEVSTRPAADIDLLVRPDQFPAAKKVLLGLGYKDYSENFESIPYFGNESSFIHGRVDYRIDLHWTMHPYNRVDREKETVELVGRAVEVRHGALAFKALDPEDEFIQSARHMMWNHLNAVRLVWVWDLLLVAKRIEERGTWPEVHQRAVNCHAAAAVWQALEMVRTWTGFSPSAPYGERITWPVDDHFEQALWRHIIDGRHGILDRMWLAWNPRWPVSRKLSFVLRLLFPPADIMRHNYPPIRPWLLPLSYLVRFYRSAQRIMP